MAKKVRKIKSIEETRFDVKNTTEYGYNSTTSYDGIVVTLSDDSTIKMGIQSIQDCCEQFGYLLSNDNTDSFVGNTFLKIEVVNTKLETVQVPELDCGGVMFINIYTNKGLLQFVAYNSHNGYYGHDAVLIENETVVETKSL